jgi:hypothetical protein
MTHGEKYFWLSFNQNLVRGVIMSEKNVSKLYITSYLILKLQNV